MKSITTGCLLLILLALLCRASCAAAGWSFPKRHVPFDLESRGLLSRCSIDRRPQLTAAEFASHYLDRKPVIFGQPIDPASDACAASLTPQELLARLGPDLPLPFIDLSGVALRGFRVAPLAQALEALNATENDPAAPAGLGSHIFTREFARSPGLLDECRAPEVIEEFFTENQGESLSLGPRSPVKPCEAGIGAKGTGLPWHWHTTVWANRLIHGRKRWYISLSVDRVPGGVLDADLTPAQWVDRVYPTLSDEDLDILAECTLEPGESIYVPDSLYHQTLNLESTFFVTYGPTETRPSPATDGHNMTKVEAGQHCSRSGSDQQAEILFARCNSVLADYPLEPEFWLYRGVAWATMGAQLPALQSFLHAHQAAPWELQPLLNAVALMLDLKEFDRAAQMAQRLHSLHPTDLQACVLVAHSLKLVDPMAAAKSWEECRQQAVKVLQIADISGFNRLLAVRVLISVAIHTEMARNMRDITTEHAHVLGWPDLLAYLHMPATTAMFHAGVPRLDALGVLDSLPHFRQILVLIDWAAALGEDGRARYHTLLNIWQERQQMGNRAEGDRLEDSRLAAAGATSSAAGAGGAVARPLSSSPALTLRETLKSAFAPLECEDVAADNCQACVSQGCGYCPATGYCIPGNRRACPKGPTFHSPVQCSHQ